MARVLHERLAHPGADLLARDHLRHRERGRAHRQQLARPDRVALHALAGGHDHAGEQHRVHGIDRGVVLRLHRVGCVPVARLCL